MLASGPSYSSVLKEDSQIIRATLNELVRSGDSRRLSAYLYGRQCPCNMLAQILKNPSNNETLNLLMIAAIDGHDAVVRAILSHAPKTTNIIELEGRVHSVSGDLVKNVTALWCALDRAHYDVARTLIELGKAEANHGPQRPLVIDAVIRGRLDTVRFLVDNSYVDINQIATYDQENCSSLIVAAGRGHTSIVDYLIKHGADLEYKTTSNGNSALAIAAIEGHLEIVRLLSAAGASPRALNHANKTPVGLAAENNKLDIVTFLLEHHYDNRIFDDLELDIASHILTQRGTDHYQRERMLKFLRLSLLKRSQMNLPKSIAQSIAVYDLQFECQSMGELEQIQDNDDRLCIEALLINERILVSRKDERLLTPLFDRAAKLVESSQFGPCLDLILHIFQLSQQIESSHCDKQYFWLFYNMLNSGMSIPLGRFWEIFDLVYPPSKNSTKDIQQRDMSYLLAKAAKMDRSEIPLILEHIGLTDDDVVCIYNHGSWPQGTCTPKSDRDLIVVKRSSQLPMQFRPDFDYFHKFELHKIPDKYDICVYSVDNFKLALEKSYLICVQCLFLPEEFKLKEEIDFRTIYLNEYFDPVRLKKVAFYEIYSTLKMLDPKNESNHSYPSSMKIDPAQSRNDFIFKNLFHGIRYLDAVEQLIRTRSIDDLPRIAHLLRTMKTIRGDPIEDANMPKVVEFVREKSDEFKAKLDAIVPTKFIKGTFASEITFNCHENAEEIIQRLKDKCLNTKYQIDLSRCNVDEEAKKTQQVTLIASYHGEYPSIVNQIKQEVQTQFQDFSITGFKVKSLMTNEGLPHFDIDVALFWDGQKNYFEFHYPVYVSKENEQKICQILKEKCQSNSKLNVTMTPHIRKRDNQHKWTYTIKQCLFGIGAAVALERDQECIRDLQKRLRLLSKIDRYFVVYDGLKVESDKN